MKLANRFLGWFRDGKNTSFSIKQMEIKPIELYFSTHKGNMTGITGQANQLSKGLNRIDSFLINLFNATNQFFIKHECLILFLTLLTL